MAKRRHALQNTANLALNRTFTMPLHRQLYDRLRHAILSGQLQPGHEAQQLPLPKWQHLRQKVLPDFPHHNPIIGDEPSQSPLILKGQIRLFAGKGVSGLFRTSENTIQPFSEIPLRDF